MDINKQENLLDNNNTQGKNELKELYEDTDDKKENKEEIPYEVQLNDKPKTEDYPDNNNKKKDLISDATSNNAAPIGKKEMKTILLNLNSYWLGLMGSISLIVSLLIYETIGLVVIASLGSILSLEIDKELFRESFELVFKEIGLKWFLFITMSQHLSVGFFCLTTFSSMLKETQNIRKFFIVSFIKVALYYVLSVIILKVLIKDGVKDFIYNGIEKIDQEAGLSKKDRLFEIADKLVDKLLNIVANFLSTFNTFIEKLALGSIYIFLFYESEKLKGKKLLIFRYCSLIPILYIILSLVFRALDNTKVLEINVFISPLLLGPKITVYVFFISTLAFIKYKSLKYQVFDEENNIQPRVFTTIGSRNFGIMGILELIIGLFVPSWSPVGIGGKYLLVLCAPIMTLYDYKRNYVLKFPCCGKGNMTLCFKIILLIFGWILVIILGIFDLVGAIAIIAKYLLPIFEFANENLDIVAFVIDLIIA